MNIHYDSMLGLHATYGYVMLKGHVGNIIFILVESTQRQCAPCAHTHARYTYATYTHATHKARRETFNDQAQCLHCN